MAREALTAEEAKALRRCERALSRHQKAAFAAGEALIEIRQDRLYRAKYGKFEIYCQMKWGLNSSQACLLMRSARCRKALQDAGSETLPTSVMQCQALSSGLSGAKGNQNATGSMLRDGIGPDGWFTDDVSSQIVSRWRKALEDCDNKPTALAIAYSINGSDDGAIPTRRLQTYEQRLVLDLNVSAKRIVEFYTPDQINELIRLVMQYKDESLRLAA